MRNMRSEKGVMMMGAILLAILGISVAIYMYNSKSAIKPATKYNDYSNYNYSNYNYDYNNTNYDSYYNSNYNSNYNSEKTDPVYVNEIDWNF